MIRRHLDCAAHVVAQLLLVVDDLHRASAEHIGGTYHDGITDAGCPSHGVCEICHADALGARDLRLRQNLIEALTILGAVDVIDGGAIDPKSCTLEFRREIDRGLAAKLDDDSVRLFLIDNVEHILDGQRLEVETVGDVKVRADRLRIIVDDDGLDAHLTQCPDRMHRAVVEFDTLPDADGT